MSTDQILALVITLVLETALALWLTRRWPVEARPRWTRVLLITLSASMITHPLLYGLVRWRPDLLPREARIALWETAVTLVETLVFWRGLPCAFRRAFLLSLACNALSLFLPMVVLALC